MKHFLPHSALKSLYYSIIHCHFTYCISVWGNSSSSEKLFKLQKRAVRIINKSNFRSHTDPLFKADLILKLNDLYQLFSSLFMFDYKYGNLPQSFRNFFNVPNDQNRQTRQLNNIYTNIPRTNFSAASPFHSIPNVWNNLRNPLKEHTKRNKLIKSLKEEYFNRYLINVTCENPRCTQCNK